VKVAFGLQVVLLLLLAAAIVGAALVHTSHRLAVLGPARPYTVEEVER